MSQSNGRPANGKAKVTIILNGRGKVPRVERPKPDAESREDGTTIRLWRVQQLPKELERAYGPKGPKARTIIIPTCLLKICRTYHRAAVLERIIYHVGSHPAQREIPAELCDGNGGHWARLSVNKLAKLCKLVWRTVDRAVEYLQGLGYIDVRHVKGKTWMRARHVKIKAAIRKAYGLPTVYKR